MSTIDVTEARATAASGAPIGHRNARAPATEKGRLRDLLAQLGVDRHAVHAADPQLCLTLWHVRQGGTLLLEGELSRTLYVVRSGTLKSARTLEDGYQKILSLALPGELLGYEALHGGRQPSTLIALEETTVYGLPLRDLGDLRLQCPLVDEALHIALSRQLTRAADTAAMNSAVSSDVRLARFLIWMSTRMADLGQSSRRILLRMGRRDIASLLCITHETVSRAFTSLADAGYLTIDRKEVEILDIEELRIFARCSRGLPRAAEGARHAAEANVGKVPTAWDASLETALTGQPREKKIPARWRRQSNPPPIRS